jgi:hypothetical protein
MVLQLKAKLALVAVAVPATERTPCVVWEASASAECHLRNSLSEIPFFESVVIPRF